MKLKTWAVNVLVAIDQLANTICLGDEDETISSRAGRGKLRGDKHWIVIAAVVDFIMRPFDGSNHCVNKIEWQLIRNQTKLAKLKSLVQAESS